MKLGVVVFPGSNCEVDAFDALRYLGYPVEYLWHKETRLPQVDGVILPGGFSYGDYLRAGAIAAFSPLLQEIRVFADRGGLVLGICNGFQILTEAGLLPGALGRNQDLVFHCETVHVRLETKREPFNRGLAPGDVLALPIAHGEGNYYADPATLAELKAHDQIVLRYVNAVGEVTAGANPNGSLENIAGICNRAGNVFGLMPHPERRTDPILGQPDGARLLRSLLA